MSLMIEILFAAIGLLSLICLGALADYVNSIRRNLQTSKHHLYGARVDLAEVSGSLRKITAALRAMMTAEQRADFDADRAFVPSHHFNCTSPLGGMTATQIAGFSTRIAGLLAIGTKVHCAIDLDGSGDHLGEVGTVDAHTVGGDYKVKLHPCGQVVTVAAGAVCACEWSTSSRDRICPEGMP